MFLNYVNSDDILGQINVNRLIYRTSTLHRFITHWLKLFVVFQEIQRFTMMLVVRA